MRELVKVFKALSDANRLRILKMLEVRPLCVCEITAVLGLATSTVSKHLSILREARLILDEKQGKWVTYRLNLEHPSPYGAALLPLLARWLPDEKIVRQDKIKIENINRSAICKT